MEKWKIHGKFPSPNIFPILFFFLIISIGTNIYLNSMVCVQQTVRIWFNAGVCNTINSQEAHFVVHADDVTRQEDFMKVQMLAAFFHSFHTVVQRTKYSCFLAISPEFLLTSYSSVRLRSADLKLLRKSTCKISLFFNFLQHQELEKSNKKSTYSVRIPPSIYTIYKVCRFESYRS